KLAIAIAFLLVVAACSSPDTTETTTTEGGTTDTGASTETTAAPGTTEAPVPGGTVVVGRTGDIDQLDPHLATAFQSIDALRFVHDSLTEIDPDLNVQPGLASSWEYDEDGTELTFHLREGVTFHDGDAFTSADVKASLERILDEETGAAGRNFILAIEAISTPDDYTVVLALSTPDATLPSAFTRTNLSILSDAAIAAGTVGTQPNGTGPFMWNVWNQGQSVELDSNPDYWGGAPAIDGVSIRVLPEEQSMLAALQAGEVHLGVMSNPLVIEQATDPLVVTSSPALGYMPMFLNSTRGALQTKEVRQGIACAIDRQELIETALFGNGVLTGPYVTGLAAGDPYDGLPCDGPDKALAQQLINDAGYADGFSFELIIITGESDVNVNIAQNIQAQLAEVGVDLVLSPLETGVYVDRWLAADFDSALSENGAGPDPHHTYVRYFPSDGRFQNVAGYNSPEMDDLLHAGQITPDPAERAEIYAQVSRTLLEESPWVWLFRGFRFQVVSGDLNGFVPHPNGSLKSLQDATLSSN
ncbi:MAG: ABC transporter substrate-binding protein, partial [Actinomycetota bacterium]